MAKRLIEFKNVYKEFDGVEVLTNINLYIRSNEFVTLLGPSGCGKTTSLRIIAGFETITRGDLFFDGQRINDLPPYKRKVNTVFQNYALFPHMNVEQNIAFGLKLKKVDKSEIKRRVTDLLTLLKLEGYGKRSVDKLSGGQRQRVAIARALINEPEVLLLDEPLAALDLKFRKDMQLELKRMQKQLGITFVYVTHDQEEALTMSDTIAVMDQGIIQQIGTPEMIYNEPQNSFVAAFIGESNRLDGTMPEDYVAQFAGIKWQCLDRGFAENESVIVVVRPEDIQISAEDAGMIAGTVRSVVFMGVHYEIRIAGDDGFEWLAHNTRIRQVGERVGLSLGPDDIHIMKRSVYDAAGGPELYSENEGAEP